MVLLDANAVLRYILNDHIDMASEVSELISNGKAFVPIFVLAEVVYVLTGVYQVNKSSLKESLLVFSFDRKLNKLLDTVSLNE